MKAFIIFRDRVTYARQCHAALTAAGTDVHVVDHASTWPPALAWLAELEDAGTTVLRRDNAYPWQLWDWDTFRDLMWGDPEPYLVTDPDVIPSDDCPADWLQRLTDVLAARPGTRKAGLGLRLDRIPDAYPGKRQILEHEAVFWEEQEDGGVYRANVDTTLALYQPYTEFPLFTLGPALRTGHPYVADHLAWYEHGPLTAELAHYHARADSGHDVPRVIGSGRSLPGCSIGV